MIHILFLILKIIWMDSSFFARNFTLTDFNNLVLSGEIQIFCKRGEYT